MILSPETNRIQGMLQKKRLGREQALQQIKHYCAYQERSHSEVKEKLYSFGLWKEDVETIIAQLIEENYLNEERYAKVFAGGKFRMKKWGRVKIKYALKQKKVSEYCIKQGLKEIEEDQYRDTLKDLLQQKWKSLRSEKNLFIKRRKATDFLVQKGYETELVSEALAELQDSGK